MEKKPKNFLVVEKDGNLANLLKKKFSDKIKIINEDILEINENFLSSETLTVYGNLPYNISTEILSKWILNMNLEKTWFNCLILMFQKEVADRIISNFNTNNYGRLTILANWRLNIKKICDIKPASFYPKPKIESSLLFFEPKKKFFHFKIQKIWKKLQEFFLCIEEKWLRNLLINCSIITWINSKLRINLNSRPQNLNFETIINWLKNMKIWS